MKQYYFGLADPISKVMKGANSIVDVDNQLNTSNESITFILTISVLHIYYCFWQGFNKQIPWVIHFLGYNINSFEHEHEHEYGNDIPDPIVC